MSDVMMSAYGYYQAEQSAGLEKQQGKIQAEMENVAALQRETDRKMELARSIGSIRAGAGAAGITGEGSPLTLIQENIKAEKRDTERDAFMTRVRSQSALMRSRMRAGAIKTEAAFRLIEAGKDAAQAGFGGGSGVVK